MSRKDSSRGIHRYHIPVASVLVLCTNGPTLAQEIDANGPALAQEIDQPSAYWLSVDTGRYFANGTSQPLLKAGTGTPAQSDRIRDAWALQVSFGGKLIESSPDWDFRLGYTRIEGQTHDSSVNGDSGGSLTMPNGEILALTDPTTFNSRIRQSFDIGDFDIGHNSDIGPVGTRAFLGARFVSFNQSTRASILGGEGAVELSCSHYFGAGPRAGVDGNYPLGEVAGTKISLTGELAGAALLGQSYHKATVTSVGTTTPITLGEAAANMTTQPAFNANASIGLTFAFPLGASEGVVAAGYQGQGWWRVANTKVQNWTMAGSGGTSNGNQYFHGPFIKVTMKW